LSAPQPFPQPPAGGTRGAIMTAFILVVALGAVSWTGDRRLKQFLSELDDQLLGQATATLEQLVNRQREQLVSEVTVLADDNRIRATVLAPTFDQATVQDVIEDLRKSSGATLLGVLDARGNVRVVTGSVGLKGVNLGTSPSVKAAFARSTSDVWTLPDQVQIIGLAAVRSGDESPALLVKGLPLGRSQLATVEKALGVVGALFIGDRVAASSSDHPELDAVFKSAQRLGEGADQITAGGRDYGVRITRTGDGATAARLAWLVPRHHRLESARLLSYLIWCPVPLGALLLLLLVVSSRRTNGGNP
jgi:hypothetical protein